MVATAAAAAAVLVNSRRRLGRAAQTAAQATRETAAQASSRRQRLPLRAQPRRRPSRLHFFSKFSLALFSLALSLSLSLFLPGRRRLYHHSPGGRGAPPWQPPQAGLCCVLRGPSRRR